MQRYSRRSTCSPRALGRFRGDVAACAGDGDALAAAAAERGYASHAFRDLVWSLGARPAIPVRRNEADVACPPWIYHTRNQVERFWARLKEWHAVATRYEKTACCFMGVLCMAAAMDWIK